MWPFLRKTVFIVSAAILLLILLVIIVMVRNKNENGVSREQASHVNSEGFTFFDIGNNSVYNSSIRNRLEENLGTSVLETRGLIDLTFKYEGFFEKNFPQLYNLHQQLNDARGARVEHNIIRLTFRYAQRQNSPFYYVELIFSDWSKNPLFFRIKSKKEGAAIVATLKTKYGKASQAASSSSDETILEWKKKKDHLVILATKDRFGDPEYHIMIYFVDNIENLISTEREQNIQSLEAKKKAGQTAF